MTGKLTAFQSTYSGSATYGNKADLNKFLAC
jgi:hypothetical protein